MRRLFWKLLTPFVWAAHLAGLCSYKWVNVCHGARRPDRFDPLWQHQWYGAPIEELPSEVILCGWGYRTAASEGIVIFADDFAKRRIIFHRDQHDQQAMWTVELGGTQLYPVCASHVKAAYAWVCAVFGASFEYRTPTEAKP